MLSSAPLPDFVHHLHVDVSTVQGVIPTAHRQFSAVNSLRWSRVLKLCFWLGVVMIVWCF